MTGLINRKSAFFFFTEVLFMGWNENAKCKTEGPGGGGERTFGLVGTSSFFVFAVSSCIIIILLLTEVCHVAETNSTSDFAT